MCKRKVKRDIIWLAINSDAENRKAAMAENH